MRRENMLNRLAHVFVATLVEHQDRRTRAAQRAAQQSFHAQADDLVQPRHQPRAIGLVQAVFERGGKSDPVIPADGQRR